MQQHNGWVEVESQVNVGTTFRIYLPVCKSSPKQIAPIVESPTPQGQGLVEDEVPVRLLASSILKRLGYVVIEASNGPEAWALWPRIKTDVAVLLTDIIMPGGLNGRELASKLRQEKPDLKVIYTTGYSLELSQDPTDLEELETFIPKPYTAATLAKVVAQCF